MDWSSEKRLEYIATVIRHREEGIKTAEQLLYRIMFLAKASDDFLEANVQNYPELLKKEGE